VILTLAVRSRIQPVQLQPHRWRHKPAFPKRRLCPHPSAAEVRNDHSALQMNKKRGRVDRGSYYSIVVATIPTIKVKASDDRALELFPAIEGNTTLVNSSLLRSVLKSAHGILNNKVITSDLMQLSNHQLNIWSKFSHSVNSSCRLPCCFSLLFAPPRLHFLILSSNAADFHHEFRYLLENCPQRLLVDVGNKRL